MKGVLGGYHPRASDIYEPGEVKPPHLGQREIELLGLLAQGCTNKEIGERMYILPGTVKGYMRNLRHKVGATNRTQLALWWAENWTNYARP